MERIIKSMEYFMVFSVMHTQWGNAFSTFQSELRMKFAHRFIIKDFVDHCTF